MPLHKSKGPSLRSGTKSNSNGRSIEEHRARERQKEQAHQSFACLKAYAKTVRTNTVPNHQRKQEHEHEEPFTNQTKNEKKMEKNERKETSCVANLKLYKRERP